MDQIEQPQSAIQRSVSEHYIDLEGKKQPRASGTDFNTLSSRHVEVILNLPGFQEDKELVAWIGGFSRMYYEQGEYAKAQQYLKWSLKRMPALEPYIFYYIRVCEHVLSIPLTNEEAQYETKLTRSFWASPKMAQMDNCLFSNTVCGASGVAGTPDTSTQMYRHLVSTPSLTRVCVVARCILCHLGGGIAQTGVLTATIECLPVVMISTWNLSGTMIQRHFASIGEGR